MNPGDLVADRFELVSLAGSGGMGRVFRARDRATGATVALKVQLAERALDRPRFEREARLLAELTHPAIVRHVAHGTTASGEPYLAMEWLEGEDLAARLAAGPLTLDESLRVARQAAEALGAAHARGIVHRDLKPTNLFLEGGDVARLRLLDFGIARLGGVPRVTRTGVFVGTPGYVAPEQARADCELDPRADVFSLGCVLFECLTGKPAFSGDHLMAILMKIVFADPPRVRELRPEVPADLEALLARMLAKDPAERPRDGAAVAEELCAIGKPRPAAASGPPPAALTAGERRALSLVLIGPDPASERTEAETLGDTEVDAAGEALRAAVSASGGRLEHLAGGSLVVTMAGAELAKDEAAAAARCALALRGHVGERPLVLVTGRGQLSGFLPMGDAIDRAVSMMTARARLRAPEGERGAPIALDELTAALLDARFEVRETDAGLFLAGEHALAEGTRTLLGKATPCVGRARELSLLAETFVECAEEPVARAMLVTAPAGIGKSRLAHELVLRVQASSPDAAVWIGRGDAQRAGSPFALLGQVLRHACGIRDGEPISERRQKLLTRVAERIAPGQARLTAELLGEIVGTRLGDPSARLAAALQDAELMNAELKAAWEAFLAAECAARPVLIVLEDLHWGDQPTLSFVDGALRALPGSPLMVLALARPEVHALFPRLASERRFQEIQLMELTRKAGARLVRHVLGDAVSAETAERLAMHADGNAFYLEELIRATAEQKGEALPETVVTMVQSRLRRLDSEARRVLRAASVFGETFWSGGVTSLLGGAPQAAVVAGKLAQLATEELVVRRPESRFPSEDELAFRHALLREGAYAMLTEGDRALGHGLAAEWLEERGEIDPLVLAEHFEHGGSSERAGLHYLRAAELSYRRGEMSAAIACARRGLAGDVPASTRTPLLSLLSVSHAWCNEWDLAVPPAEEVMRLAEPGSVAWSLAALTVTTREGVTEAITLDDLGAMMRVFHALEPGADTAGTLAFCAHGMIPILDLRGAVELAERSLRRMEELFEGAVAREPAVLGWIHLAHAYRDGPLLERPWQGLKRAEAALAIFKAVGHRRGILLGQAFVAVHLGLLGAADAIDPAHRAAMLDLGPMMSLHASFAARFLADRGALDEARRVAERTIEAGGAMGYALHVWRGRWVLADVRRRAGDLAGAAREAEAAIAAFAALPPNRTAARATLAAVRLAEGRAAEALAESARAAAELEAMGGVGLSSAFVRLVHAECLDAGGDRAGARAAIAGARDRLLAVAATIDDAGYRRSFLDGVPENARTMELARAWFGSEGAALAGEGSVLKASG